VEREAIRRLKIDQDSQVLNQIWYASLRENNDSPEKTATNSKRLKTAGNLKTQKSQQTFGAT
jgi:hypothetical protein